jgi:CDP-diacylglycerol---serine O-phosphatidyltransferase
MVDKLILSFFVCCGLARLGRYNVTAHLIPKDDQSGGIKYFEGFPIPSTLSIVLILWVYHELGWAISSTFRVFGKEGHLFTLFYFGWGICMVSSNIRVPKL